MSMERKVEGGTYRAKLLEQVWVLLQLPHIGRNFRKGLSGANEKQVRTHGIAFENII